MSDWTYTAFLDRLVDGDTLDVWIVLEPKGFFPQVLPGTSNKLFDFGFSIYGPASLSFAPMMHHERVRVWGINAPEIRGEEREEGQASMRELALFFAEHADEPMTVETIKEKGKYGRYIARVNVAGIDVSTWMVENGHAQWKDY